MVRHQVTGEKVRKVSFSQAVRDPELGHHPDYLWFPGQDPCICKHRATQISTDYLELVRTYWVRNSGWSPATCGPPALATVREIFLSGKQE